MKPGSTFDMAEFSKYLSKGAYHWEETSRSIRRHNAFTAGRYRLILEVGQPWRGKKVLDVGCGDGRLGSLIAEAGARSVVGVDTSITGLKFGIQKLATSINNIFFIQADGLRFPVKDASFDVVVASEIIEHVSDPGILLEESSRVLVDSGFIIITTPYRLTEVPIDQNHQKEFYPSELRDLLKGYFRDVTITLSHPAWITELYLLSGCARLFRLLVNLLSIYTHSNPFLCWPMGRYACQMVAVGKGVLR